VSSLRPHNALQMDFRVVSIVLGGTASDVLSEHDYIYKHGFFFHLASPHSRIGM